MRRDSTGFADEGAGSGFAEVVAGLLLAGWLCFGATHVHAQEPFEGLSPFGARYDALRFLFERRGLQLGTVKEFTASKPSEWNRWIVVVLGDPAPLNVLPSGVGPFLSAGGMLLVATDGDTGRTTGNLGLWTRPGPIEVPAGRFAYQLPDGPLLPSCPLVTRFESNDPLFTGVSALVMNRPGFLLGDRDKEFAVAHLPPDARTEDGVVVGPRPIVARLWLDAGRLVLIADHSLFLNEMIREPDDGNLRFADNCIGWLQGDRAPESLQVLFFEDGDVAEGSWTDPRFETGDWPTPSLTELLDEFLLGLEEEHRETNLFNNLLLDSQRRLSLNVLRFLVPIIPTALLALLLVRWLFGARPRSAATGQPVEPDDGPLPLLHQRRQEITETNAYADPARLLARRFFANTLDCENWEHRMPPVEVEGNVWNRWHVRWQLRRLWKRARGLGRWRTGRRRFFALGAEVDRLTSLVRAGVIRRTPSAPAESDADPEPS